MKEKIINWLIRVTRADTNKISDGYHTFEDLYEHRIELWIAFCKKVGLVYKGHYFWKSRTHSDGSKWDGWFIVGMETKKGKQITYHLPEKYWDRLSYLYVRTLKKAPEYDGHTPSDVINRLQNL